MEGLTALDTQLLGIPGQILPEDNRQLLEELNRELETRVKPVKKQETKPVKRDEKEISDAILAVIEEGLKENGHDIEADIERERLMYAALETQQKGLDYSKLHYGKVAQPLAVRWEYSQYQENENGFAANETITMEEVEEIIEEKAYADVFHQQETFLKANTDERFKYWKLFNSALNLVKYDLAFT